MHRDFDLETFKALMEALLVEKKALKNMERENEKKQQAEAAEIKNENEYPEQQPVFTFNS